MPESIKTKQCNRCYQILPMNHFKPVIGMPLGSNRQCYDCEKHLKNDWNINRNCHIHNELMITTALAKMPFTGFGLNVPTKDMVMWTINLVKYDTVVRVTDSNGSVILSHTVSQNIPLGQKIDQLVSIFQALGIRLELQKLDVNMARKILYHY